jgi:hypothetical protein
MLTQEIEVKNWTDADLDALCAWLESSGRRASVYVVDRYKGMTLRLVMEPEKAQE